MVLAASLFAACTSPYDDTAISNRIDKLEDRVVKLEEMCRQFNTNIASLQTVVEVLRDNDYITGVTPVKEGGVEVGYTITLKSGKIITIYHGKGADDGATDVPVIGVRQDADGNYYWTLDGEWLLDEDGKKVKAQGDDAGGGDAGKDGVTPKLKIENEYWYVSYDDGGTWERLGKATAAAGESMFNDVRFDDENVYLILYDGTELVVPRTQPLAISFDAESPVSLNPDSETDIEYTISSSAEKVTIDVTSSVDLKAKVVPVDMLHGSIHVESGSILDEYSKVTVFVSDGSKTLVHTLNFEAMQGEVFKLSTNKVSVPAAGGEFTVKVTANIGYYISSMPDWIKEVSKEENPKTHVTTHVFKAESNKDEDDRSGVVVFCNDSQVCIPVTVSQPGSSNWMVKGFYHRSLVMRFTATWCSNCPNMADALKKAQKELPDKLEVISLHGSNSELEFGGTDALQYEYGAISAYPTAVVDGRIAVENNLNQSEIIKDVKEAYKMTESVYSTATGVSFSSSLSNDRLTVDVNLYAIYPEEYKVTVFILEDNIVAEQIGSEEGKDYVHNSVVRASLTDALGNKVTTTAAYEEKPLKYILDIPSGVNPDNLRILVYTQRQYGSQDAIKSAGFGDWYVDNCAVAKIGETLELKLAE